MLSKCCIKSINVNLEFANSKTVYSIVIVLTKYMGLFISLFIPTSSLIYKLSYNLIKKPNSEFP